MVESDKKTFALLIGVMHETFGKAASRPAIEGYWLSLADIEWSSCQRAIHTAMMTCDFLPTPSKIRQIVVGGTDEDIASQAWLDVVKAMPIGCYKAVSFRDPVINATLRALGGWPSLFDKCSNSQDESFYRHAFVKTYCALSHGRLDGEATAPLAGLAEVEVVGGTVVPVRPRIVGTERNANLIGAPIDKSVIFNIEFAKP